MTEKSHKQKRKSHQVIFKVNKFAIPQVSTPKKGGRLYCLIVLKYKCWFCEKRCMFFLSFFFLVFLAVFTGNFALFGPFFCVRIFIFFLPVSRWNSWIIYHIILPHDFFSIFLLQSQERQFGAIVGTRIFNIIYFNIFL